MTPPGAPADGLGAMVHPGGPRSPGGRGRAPFGVYVHVPFCLRRCDYCAFATWDDRGHLFDAYVEGVLLEIRGAVGDGLPLASSVFLGGGTPSLLSAQQVGAILDSLPRGADAEVSVECNPDTVSRDLLDGYLQAGVTRISLGIQSMVPDVLRALGRTHDVAGVGRAVDAVTGAGFASFNIDLIYGAVGESLGDWERTLSAVQAFEPPHVSAYGLTVEAGTPLAADAARHPDDDDEADKYLAAEGALSATGLLNYEVSNWARPGHECRQNVCYWAQGDYRGFGCAAHSHRSGRRWWNVRTPERYLDLLDAGRPVEAGGEVLDAGERRLEALQLALRTRGGVPVGALDTEGLDGLVETRRDRVVLTVAGRLLANEVALRLSTQGSSAPGSRRQKI